MLKTLLLLFIPSITLGQTVYTGSIIDKKTKLKVPYATVGLAKENIGTNADENGVFKLESKINNERDTLIISCVGYNTLRVAVNNLAPTIELEEKESRLREVTVNSKLQWKYVQLGSKNRKKIGITSNGSHGKVAKLFTLPSPAGVRLTKVQIQRQPYPFEEQKTIFRIRIYNMDSISKAPAEELCDEIIEVRTSNKNVNVDLEQYNIHIPRPNFFVALEWLMVEYNEHHGMAWYGKEKRPYVLYRPSIKCNNALRDNIIHIPGKMYEVWTMGYNHSWRPSLTVKDLGIMATVKY